MYGTIYSPDPSTGFYIGNDPIHTSYDNPYPSTFTTNVHLNHLHQPIKRDNINSKQTYNPLPVQSNGFNQHDNNIQHLFHTNNNQQSTKTNLWNFENDGLASTEYYNRIHARTRSNTTAPYQNPNSSSTTTTNSTFQPSYNHSSSPNPSRQPTPAIFNSQMEPTFLVVPAIELNRSSPLIQVIYTFYYQENYTRDRSDITRERRVDIFLNPNPSLFFSNI